MNIIISYLLTTHMYFFLDFKVHNELPVLYVVQPTFTVPLLSLPRDWSVSTVTTSQTGSHHSYTGQSHPGCPHQWQWLSWHPCSSRCPLLHVQCSYTYTHTHTKVQTHKINNFIKFGRRRSLLLQTFISEAIKFKQAQTTKTSLSQEWR